MNSFLCFSVFIVALFSLQAEADLIEEGCKFIRANDDLVDDMVKCETDNYPPRFNELSTTCLSEATGMTKAEHIRATCQNREHLNQALLKINTCVIRHIDEVSGMLPGITNGLQTSQACIRDLVFKRILSETRRQKRSIGLADETARAYFAIKGLY